MKKAIILFLSISFILAGCQSSLEKKETTTVEKETEKSFKTDSPVTDSLLVLENEQASLTINRWGGAYIDFQLKNSSLNPLSWGLTVEQMPPNNQAGAPFVGHFLCLGRWGGPSGGEKIAGVPHNGEQTNQWWKVEESNAQKLKMYNEAPLDGFTIERNIEFGSQASVFKISEKVKNVFSLSRPYNLVQHPTLAPPFLTKSTVVNTNADRGFLQKQSYPDPHVAEYRWPEGMTDDGKPLDLRRSDHNFNHVTTHIFPEGAEHGWVTAGSPDKQLLIGYLWKTADSPWLNVWHHTENDQPVAKGIEFGTTGIGRPYKDLIMSDTRFHGQNSFEYIDAEEEVEKSFLGFLLEIPEDFKGVEAIEYSSGELMVTERENAREYQISLGGVSEL